MRCGETKDYNFEIEKIVRCKICCFTITESNSPITYYKKGYCSELCYDEEPEPITGRCCILCGLVLIPYLHKTGKRKGKLSRTYNKSGKCEECLLIK